MALTPMMRQYLDIKEQNQDAILFFRLGDFYEMFFEDALLASKELELTLTGKDCGLDERAPMCGVPFHSAETYISRLVQRGYKVAICEQLTDPKDAKTLVERGIIRIVTPGTVVEQSMLDEKRNNYLLSICVEGKKAGFAYTDVSTGECIVFETSSGESAILDELNRIHPTEILANEAAKKLEDQIKFPVPVSAYCPEAYQKKQAVKTLMRQFKVQSLDALGVSEMKTAVCAAGALLNYVESTQLNAMEHLNHLRIYVPGQYMMLDTTARRNLELTKSLRRGDSKGTLLDLLDYTCTAMGARCLHGWVEQPLAIKEGIERRLDAIEEILSQPVRMHEVREKLKDVRDVERIIGKISYNSINPRHCLALSQSFACVPAIRQALSGTQSAMLQDLFEHLDPLEDLTDMLERMIDPDAPLAISEGGVIRSGFSPELDKLREAASNGRQMIAEMEAAEREATGIKNLRIVYHKIFGYCIEVTKSFYELVPMRYVRRQTLANCERYITSELQELEKQLLGASDRALRLEAQLFAELKERLGMSIVRMQQTAESLKNLDALLSLAYCAQENQYVRPAITEDGAISIEDGRHPVVEKMLDSGEFVPNDTQMNMDDLRMLIVTGPNMAGKSTYMRQVALITLMAHMGSFVPAKSASICLTDRIFTRIGASDDVSGGQSTFLVEMSEMAHILRNATSRSLLILDEIGRGTSTFDGLSIAWAIVEYLCGKKIGAKTLFATHYHELADLEGHIPGVANFYISVKEHGEDVIFLRRIERGSADKSFGIHVARLAGIPQAVVARAQELLARLEVANVSQNSISANILQENRKKHQQQVSLADFSAISLVEELREIDVNSMTPMEALNTLFTLREKARKI